MSLTKPRINPNNLTNVPVSPRVQLGRSSQLWLIEDHRQLASLENHRRIQATHQVSTVDAGRCFHPCPGDAVPGRMKADLQQPNTHFRKLTHQERSEMSFSGCDVRRRENQMSLSAGVMGKSCQKASALTGKLFANLSHILTQLAHTKQPASL